jgi:hypothetical protein
MEEIDTLIKPFIVGSKISTKTRIRVGNVYIRAIDYIWIYYQSLRGLSETSDFPTFLECIYDTVFKREKVSQFGKIEIDVSKDSLTTRTEIFKIDIGIATGSNFLQKIHETLENYMFLGLYVTIKISENNSHANMLLLYKNSQGVVSIALYEPHGSKNNVKWVSRVDSVIENIVTSYNTMYGEGSMININRAEVSCPLGLQSVGSTPSLRGYCLMFSYLWIYLFMTIVKTRGIKSVTQSADDTIIDIMRNLERSILTSRYVSGDKHRQITLLVMNFATYLINTYIEYVSQINKNVISILELRIKSKIIKFASSYKDSNINKIYTEKEDGSYCENSVECKSGECYQNRCINWKEENKLDNTEPYRRSVSLDLVADPYINGKSDGDNCLINSDCKSGICKQSNNIDDYGICTSVYELPENFTVPQDIDIPEPLVIVPKKIPPRKKIN